MFAVVKHDECTRSLKYVHQLYQDVAIRLPLDAQ
jgi:hypothetical protein